MHPNESDIARLETDCCTPAQEIEALETSIEARDINLAANMSILHRLEGLIKSVPRMHMADGAKLLIVQSLTGQRERIILLIKRAQLRTVRSELELGAGGRDGT